MPVPKTTKGTQLKDPNEKAQLKALFIANKKGIEEAKLECEKIMLGKGSKKKIDNFDGIFWGSYLFVSSCFKPFGTIFI